MMRAQYKDWNYLKLLQNMLKVDSRGYKEKNIQWEWSRAVEIRTEPKEEFV